MFLLVLGVLIGATVYACCDAYAQGGLTPYGRLILRLWDRWRGE